MVYGSVIKIIISQIVVRSHLPEVNLVSLQRRTTNEINAFENPVCSAVGGDRLEEHERRDD